jgi:hypothetical protein
MDLGLKLVPRGLAFFIMLVDKLPSFVRIHEIEIPIPSDIFRVLTQAPHLTTLSILPCPTTRPQTLPLTTSSTLPQKVLLIIAIIANSLPPALVLLDHIEGTGAPIIFFRFHPLMASFRIQKIFQSRIPRVPSLFLTNFTLF